jgi:hypothetical protein
MTDFSSVMFLATLIVVMNLITLLIIIVKDAKIWAKFDRVVLFLGNERNILQTEIGKMRDAILDIKEKLVKIESDIKEKTCNK